MARWKHTNAPSSPAEDEDVGVCRINERTDGNEHTGQPLLIQHVNSVRASEGCMGGLSWSRLVVRTHCGVDPAQLRSKAKQTGNVAKAQPPHPQLPQHTATNLNRPQLRSTYRHTLHAKGEGQ